MKMDDLLRELQQRHGVMTLHMGRLRDAYGAGKLGVNVVDAISEELTRRRIGFYPTPLPRSQNELVRLYDLDLPSGKIIRAVATLGDEQSDEILRQTSAEAPPQRSINANQDQEHLSDVIRCLNQAESRNHFVALTWFRDVALPAENFGWVNAGVSFDQLLRDAIDHRTILTSKVHNPRNPERPVTAIRLNRQAAEVRAALSRSRSKPRGFQPLNIRGEGLSRTVLKDRR